MLNQQPFIQNNISQKKTEQWLTFPHSHPEGSGICHNVPMDEWFQHRFWALQTEPLWDSFLQFHIILASAAFKMLLQRNEKIKVTWCQVRRIWWMFETHPSEFLWQGCHLSGYGGLGPKWLSSFWSSEEASWWSQMANWRSSARSCLTMVLFTKHRILCWRHALTCNTPRQNVWTFRVTMWENRSLFCFLMWKVNLKINCWISIHSLCVFTLWSPS